VARYREVIEEPEFRRAIEEIAKRYPRADEVVAALSWSLARSPEQHFHIPGTPHSLIKSLAFAGVPEVPPLRVLFRFDAERVVLMRVMLASETFGREP